MGKKEQHCFANLTCNSGPDSLILLRQQLPAFTTASLRLLSEAMGSHGCMMCVCMCLNIKSSSAPLLPFKSQLMLKQVSQGAQTLNSLTLSPWRRPSRLRGLMTLSMFLSLWQTHQSGLIRRREDAGSNQKCVVDINCRINTHPHLNDVQKFVQR